MIRSTFFLPLNFTIKILKNNCWLMLLENCNDHIIMPLKGEIKVNNFCHTITIMNNINKFTKYFNEFLYNYSCVNLKIIKFKGKGYKLTKKSNTLTFLFNFSHISFFVSRSSILKKIYKNRFALINWDKRYLNTTSLNIVGLRYADIFTLNGFRVKRQKIWKKRGKTLSS